MICEVKAKALITAQLICIFVFTYVKVRFSHDAAQLCHNTYVVYCDFTDC